MLIANPLQIHVPLHASIDSGLWWDCILKIGKLQPIVGSYLALLLTVVATTRWMEQGIFRRMHSPRWLFPVVSGSTHLWSCHKLDKHSVTAVSLLQKPGMCQCWSVRAFPYKKKKKRKTFVNSIGFALFYDEFLIHTKNVTCQLAYSASSYSWQDILLNVL